MKTCYLDTNVLVYFGDSASPFHQEAKTIVQRLIDENFKLAVSSLTLDEYLFTVMKYSDISGAKMKDILRLALESVFQLPGLELINPSLDPKQHLKVIDFIVTFHLRPRDSYHLLIMVHNKSKFLATFDRDFEKVFASGLVQKFS